jgi:vitamin B12 transporter
MNIQKLLCAACCAIILATCNNAFCDEQSSSSEKGIEIDPIVVTADRRKEPLDQVTYPMSYVDEEEIDEQQAQSASEILDTQVGVDIISAGSPGDETDIRIRGSDSDEVLVLLDGVPINTVLNNRPTALGTIPASFIDHVEIIRGAHSGMYGSRAVGGVVNIITRKGKEGVGGMVGFRGGNLGRLIEDAAFSLGKGNHRLRLAYQRWDQAGRFFNDRLAQNAMNLNWHFQWTPQFEVSFSPTYLNTTQELPFDSVMESPTLVYFPRDTNRRLRRDTVVLPFSLALSAVSWWESYFDYSLYYQFFRIENPPTGDVTPGTIVGDQYGRGKEFRHRISFRNVFKPLDHKGFVDRFTLGYDMDAESLEYLNGPYNGPWISFPLPGQQFDRRNDAIYIQNAFEYKKYITVSGGYRYDHNTLFEDSQTARAAVLARIPKWGTTFKGSYNETFNAPLIMTINFNPVIQKEKAQNYSVGVEQALGKIGLFQTYFFYIDYDSFFFDNVDTVGTSDAYSMGVEASFDIKPLDWLRFRGNYTWLRSRDETRDVPLPNRPNHRFVFIGDVQPIKGFNLQLLVKYVGTRYWGSNTNVVFINSQGVASDGKLDPYVKLDFAGTYTLPLKSVARSIEFTVKVENILNQDYEEQFGHPMPGINFLAGAKANF